MDGTLTDSSQGIQNAVLFALEKMNIRETDPESLRQFIGPPLHHTFKTRYALADEAVNSAVAFYREYYQDKGLYENNLYDGIKPLLEQLAAARHRLFVVTSKQQAFARTIAGHFKLDVFFEDIIGSNPDHTMADKTALIRHTLTLYELDPAATVMVGDRKYDLIGARNNGVTAAGVLYGYGTEMELREHKADHLLATVDALGRFLLN